MKLYIQWKTWTALKHKAPWLAMKMLFFFFYPLIRLFTAARTDSEAKIFSGCAEIIFSACGIVGGVVGNQDTAPGFLGAGMMHNSPW